MGVKNNFSQAVSELIGISRNVEPDKKEDTEGFTDEVLEMETITEDVTGDVTEEEKGAVQDMEDTQKDTDLMEEHKEDAPQASPNPKERIMAMLAAQQAAQQQAQPQPQSQAETFKQAPPQPQAEIFKQAPPQPRPAGAGGGGLTTIAKGTVIIGEINADGDVELLGSVKGKIASQGDIKANGKVIGDLIGRNIELISCAVQGNIVASGAVTVDGDSIVVGDVKGENFCLDGKIKGNVTIEKEAKFQPKAILAGNVTTASIAMSQGAKIQGEVNIPLSEKETDMSFDIDMTI